jgi:hypothetical protein
MLSASRAEITASGWTLVNSAIFRFSSARNLAVGAAQQDVGLDADLAQFLDRVLGRLGLEFAGRGDPGHQRQVDVAGVLAAFLDAHLADGFEEGQRLDVAHGAADFDDRHVGAFGTALDENLDFVGDVRNDLDGLAEVLATALLLDHRLVDLAGGEVVALAHLGAGEALVMAQVEVGLGAVLGDEHLTVLERRHGAGVDVDVGIELEVGNLDAARFKDCTEAGGGYPLAQTGHDTTGNENVFGHGNAAAGNSNHSGNSRPG